MLDVRYIQIDTYQKKKIKSVDNHSESINFPLLKQKNKE